MIYDGGIFRDVYLTSRPLVQISDYTVQTDLDDSYQNAMLNLNVNVRNLASAAAGGGWSVKVDVLDRDGKNLTPSASIPIVSQRFAMPLISIQTRTRSTSSRKV